jgi:hypothetical protein
MSLNQQVLLSMRQFGRIIQRCCNVLRSKRGITANDLFNADALGVAVENNGDGDAGSERTPFTTADCGVARQVVTPRHIFDCSPSSGPLFAEDAREDGVHVLQLALH